MEVSIYHLRFMAVKAAKSDLGARQNLGAGKKKINLASSSANIHSLKSMTVSANPCTPLLTVALP